MSYFILSHFKLFTLLLNEINIKMMGFGSVSLKIQIIVNVT